MSGPCTLSELAGELGVELRGDGSVRIVGVNTLAGAGAEEITWVSDDRHAARLGESRAGAVVVPRAFGETPMPSLRTDSVEVTMARLLGRFAPAVPGPGPGVHPTAVVADSAVLGANVAVGPHAVIGARAHVGPGTVLHAGVHVGDDCRVGSDCLLWNHVVIRERCEVGHRVILHPHVVIGSDGFGYYFSEGRHNKIPHGGRVVVGDDVEIGAGSTLDRSKVGETVVGPGTKIDNLVQIGHNVRIGAHCILIAHCGIGGSAQLGDGVVLGGQVGIRDNITLGDGVVVAACSCVSRDIPPGRQVGGIPAYDHGVYRRVLAVTPKLPDIGRQVKDLAKRVERLEAAADHS
jgi:UDP-3-O-[3-hydroxymyristoyl] glucosamine N-acyltransferase